MQVWLAILQHVTLKLWDGNEWTKYEWTNDDEDAIAMGSCTTFRACAISWIIATCMIGLALWWIIIYLTIYKYILHTCTCTSQDLINAIITVVWWWKNRQTYGHDDYNRKCIQFSVQSTFRLKDIFIDHFINTVTIAC